MRARGLANLILSALLLAGCSTVADPVMPVGERDLRGEMLTARDLGPYLDDLEERSNEQLITGTAGFLEEVERQAVLDDWQRTIVSRDGSIAVTVEAIRFRNAAFGRELFEPKAERDPRPPRLPPGAQPTVGELRDDYAERAAVFSKGPLFIRIEVISTSADARADSRDVLTRASRLQFDKLSLRRNLPGDSLEVGRLKRRLGIGVIASVVATFLLVGLVTAVRDPTVRRRFVITIRGRPDPPAHAIDVDLVARMARTRLARRARRRAYLSLAVVGAVMYAPTGFVLSVAILIGCLVAWNLIATLASQALGESSTPRLFTGWGLAIGLLASSLTLALSAAGAFVIWLGIVAEVNGFPSVSDDGLSRLRTIALVLGAGLLVLSRVPLGLGRRLAMRRFAKRMQADPRESVLLLRSFTDDHLKIRTRQYKRSGLDRLAMRRWERFEESLAFGLYELGPVEALGEPGQKLRRWARREPITQRASGRRAWKSVFAAHSSSS